MSDAATILDLYIGHPEHRWDGKAPSAIRKSRADGSLKVTDTGLVGDGQADLSVHGGPEKALHIYPSEHYADWRKEFPEKADIYMPGGFGENLSTEGFTEKDICIGDVFAAGSVRLQVSQGRQPCWKLNMHTGNPAQAAAFQKSGRTGWYFRVLETGYIKSGDELNLIERPCAAWNLHDVILARFNPRLDPAIAQALAQLEPLAEPWRTAFAKKSKRGHVEDTSKRLNG